MAADQQATSQSNIAIKQLNLAYHTAEDRLMLKIGLSDQSELQVWITYRVARQLWAHVSAESNLPSEASSKQSDSPQSALAQFREEAKAVETLNKLDFGTEYNDDDYKPRKQVIKDAESGEEKEMDGVMLAVELHKKGESPNVTMVFTCDNGFNLNLNLNSELTLAILTMLQMAAKEAMWPLNDASAAPSLSVVVKEEDNQTVH